MGCLIIGLVGQNCSGKDTAADYLVTLGCSRYSLSDYLREELKQEGKEVTRDSLIEIANRLRKTKGTGYLGEKARERITPGKNWVVVSIRNPGEVQELRKLKGFVLVVLEASAEKRFERMKARKREQDPKTLEEFVSLEKQENAGGAEQSISQTMKLADFTVDASGTIDEELAEVDKLWRKLKNT
ncbi:MAG: AAA family ATPase [Candidatus Micrarchaeota archaeon]